MQWIAMLLLKGMRRSNFFALGDHVYTKMRAANESRGGGFSDEQIHKNINTLLG
jgi:hypothetical protein